jgi:hypothetical protein
MTAPGSVALTPDAARRFAYRQGPGKRLLHEQNQVDDAAPTTALLPPPHARGASGLPLPSGGHAALAAIPFPAAGPRPGACDDTVERLGRILLAAFGLQRREPDQLYADHRAVASGRAKYPVHVFVVDRETLRYLDVYRHALIDVPHAPRCADDDALHIVLAARYSDLPAAYGRLRFAVCEAELGIAMRSLSVAADVFGVRLTVEPVSSACLADRAPSCAGPGVWSASVTLRPHGLGPLPRSRTVPGAVGGPVGGGERDRLLESVMSDSSVAESAAVSAARRTLPAGSVADTIGQARGLPDRAPATPTPLSWSDVLWRRSSGRVSGGRYGFALRPAPVPRATLDSLLAWAAVPAADGAVAAVGRLVRTTLVLRAIEGLADGVYRLGDDGRPHLLRADARALARLEPGFARPSSPTTDIGLRHAAVFWVHSAATGRLLDEFGPGGLALLNLWCGWTIHGLCLAAAAAGLIARPARSYDEHHLQPLLVLEGEEFPVFTIVCGTPRFTSPMLDLRS